MTEPETAELGAFLSSLEKPVLTTLLVELAASNENVRKRLERLQLAADPRKLAAAFKRTLAGWRRSTAFIGYRESHAFGAELEAWLDQIEQELLPKDAERALDLFEAFIESGRELFEHADDSDGCIGEALRSACERWLHAATQCKDSDSYWVERIYALVKADEYGARVELLRGANLVLEEAALRMLAARFEGDLYVALKNREPTEPLPAAVFSASAAVGLVAEALRDPDLSIRAVLSYSPNPNELQKARFAEGYLRFGRPEQALVWMEGDWGRREDERLRLLAEAYSSLRRDEEASDIRQRIFEGSGTVEDFRAWRASLALERQAQADDAARQRAQANGDPIAAACLLLQINEDRAAEVLLVERFVHVNGNDYPRLVPLAEAMEANGRLLGCTACYRALLQAILSRAYARAYSHAARYLKKLRELVHALPDLAPLESHAAFEAQLRSKHGRKASFWNLMVKG
ncbi:MAG: DUF6880 family protein [Gammaproteobacteria bacterium]